MKMLMNAMFMAALVILVACAGTQPLQAQEPTAQATLTLNWGVPVTGDPATEYALTCTGTFAVDVTTPNLQHVTPPVAVSNGDTISGSCSLAASNAAGASAPATMNYLYTVNATVAPGTPTNFQILLNCTMQDGVVACTQG